MEFEKLEFGYWIKPLDRDTKYHLKFKIAIDVFALFFSTLLNNMLNSI